MTNNTELPPMTSEELFATYQSPERDQSLLEHYGTPSERKVFEAETSGAASFIADAQCFWSAVSDMEIQVNEALLMLRQFAIMPMSLHHNHTVEHYLSYYYEKVIRHIRFFARVEAIAMTPLRPHFVVEYAQEMYPRLVRKIQSDPNLVPFLREIAR